MKKIWPWLLPTLVAPMLGACVYVFFVSRGSSIPAVAWIVAACVASALSFFVAMMMAVTDVALLKMKLRMPPTGWRAWLMGLVAPMPVLWCWQKLIKFAITGIPQLILTFLLPMLLVALVMRVFLGTRPDTWESR